MAAKTFEFDEELPDLPLPELNDTLNLYLDTLRPFLSLNTFKEVEVIVRDFENGIGQKLQEKLRERACNNKNWVRMSYYVYRRHWKFYDNSYRYIYFLHFYLVGRIVAEIWLLAN